MKILLGTKNKGKIAKFGNILEQLEIKWCTPYTIEGIDKLIINETGETTEENSIIKAKAYYKATGLPVLCDDSALLIDKFPADKQPGVFVHRHNGKELNDSEIIELYTDELNKIGGESQGAFHITLCIIDKNGNLHTQNFKSPRYFISKPSNKVVENFPLRSLIYYKEYNRYMSEMTVDEAEIAEGETIEQEKEFIKSVFK